MKLYNVYQGTDSLPPDGGIMYAETDMHRLIPEPLNTVTAVFFIIISIYWLLRLKGFSFHSLFLSTATYILLVGSIGGTAYHGLRQYKFFILMDWVPIVILCLMASVYFWSKILSRRIYAVIPVACLFLLQFFLRFYLEDDHNLDWAISLNYGAMAVMIIAPLLIYTSHTEFKSVTLVYAAIVCFAAALYFRVSDNNYTSVGTHFLWHTLGAVATHLMFLYIYRIETQENVTEPIGS